jgi:hypothetical protein
MDPAWASTVSLLGVDWESGSGLPT